MSLNHSKKEEVNVEVRIPLVEDDSNPKAVVQKTARQIKAERGSAFRQVLAAFVANLGTVNTGLVFGFSAVVLPQLQSPNSTIYIDEEQASWVGEYFFKL